ncbi:hypothetical protein NW762_013316 [Fusarium torreyae]|uniref:Ankyrin n=1 Tax=Fusarium torreyae TaxID=1237075 RepID=A0A9W8VAI3_9HYPO|nr:hypothetical protein NW762_013316 [Fusarium torreyae]
MAILEPSRMSALLVGGHNVDAQDKNGMTPLMYAAAMGLQEPVAILMSHGSNLFMKDSIPDQNYDFIRCAAAQQHWDLVWFSLNWVAMNEPCLLPRLSPSILAETGNICYSHHDSKSIPNGFIKFWSKLIPMLGDLNTLFDDGSTILHAIDQPDIARGLVNLGFNRFNQKDEAGEHPLFRIAQFRNSSLFQLFVEKGSDVNLRNNLGRTVLHDLVDGLSTMGSYQVKGLLEIMNILLDSGGAAAVQDNCTCECSSGGCMPGLHARFEIFRFGGMMINNGLWVFEWLHMLEEREGLLDAKDFALSILRKAYFEEAGLQHTCCQSDDATRDENMFWDIPKQLRFDELNERINYWGKKGYEEVKLQLMVHLQKRLASNEADYTTENGHSGKKWLDTADLLRVSTYICLPNFNIRRRLTDTQTEGQNSGCPPGTDGDLFDVCKIMYECSPAFGRDRPKNDATAAFNEFVSELRTARGDKISDRLPLLTQLAGILRVPLPKELQENSRSQA